MRVARRGSALDLIDADEITPSAHADRAGLAGFSSPTPVLLRTASAEAGLGPIERRHPVLLHGAIGISVLGAASGSLFDAQ